MLPIIKEGRKLCVINPADVTLEENNWSASLICAVLGAKPPLAVSEGFVRRIWSSFGVDKVLRLPNGHFIVKFSEVNDRDGIVDHGIWFFEWKPLVVRPWVGDFDVFNGIKSVPVWVRLAQLSVKYWNEGSLSLICSLLGTPLMIDKITKNRTWLNFARVLIKVEIGDKLVEEIQFVNEYGQVVDQVVEYEWLPVKCQSCKCLGILRCPAE